MTMTSAHAGTGSALAPGAAQRRPLAAATRTAYASDWALFTDWCAATGRCPLPATVPVLVAFLDANPASPTTTARRLAALTHHHAQAGYASPAHDPAVRARVRTRSEGSTARGLAGDALAAAVRSIPTHGWPGGLLGRRDRLLLTVAFGGGLSYRQLHRLHPADLTVTRTAETGEQGAAALLVHTGGEPVRLPATATADLCPACAWRRWARVLALAARYPGTRILRAAFHRARPLTPASAHLCQIDHAGPDAAGSTNPVARGVFCRADQYGYLDRHHQLSTRTIARILTSHAAGHPPTYRLPDPTPAADAVPEPTPEPTTRPECSPAGTHPRMTSAQTGRTQDHRLADLDIVFGDLDQRIDQLTDRLDDLTDQLTGLHRDVP